MTALREALARWRGAPLASPAGLVLRALWLAGLFLVAHLAGLRSSMSALALTFPPGTSPELGFFLCGLYLLLYLLALALVPPLLLAALLLRLWGHLSPPPEA